MSMREVAAVSKIQSKNRVAGLQDGGVSGLIGLRAGVRLHVGMLRSKEFFGTLPRQIFDDIGKLASAVIALAGITFRVLVGEHGPGGFKHSLADKVFRSDQLQPFMLAANFVVDSVRNLGINFIERTGHRGIFHGWAPEAILLRQGHSCPRKAADLLDRKVLSEITSSARS